VKPIVYQTINTFFIKILNGNICVLSKHLKPCAGLFAIKHCTKGENYQNIQVLTTVVPAMLLYLL